MPTRPKIPVDTEIQLLTQCRRRCAICFGLSHDDGQKHGQIAHLDHDPKNNKIDNLAYLCLEHHDQYDTKRSQSKGLQLREVKHYRAELMTHLKTWHATIPQAGLLSFIAFAFDINISSMADAAIKAGNECVFYGASHAREVLSNDSFSSMDMDLYMPYLMALDTFQAWGWLTYTYNEAPDPDDDNIPYMHINVTRKPICNEVAKAIGEKKAANKSLL